MKKSQKSLFLFGIVILMFIGIILTNDINDIQNDTSIKEQNDRDSKEIFNEKRPLKLKTSNIKWFTAQLIFNEITEPSDEPDIAVDKWGNVHVAWRVANDNDIFYKRWNATIHNWTIAEVVTNGDVGAPAIEVDSYGNVLIVWSS